MQCSLLNFSLWFYSDYIFPHMTCTELGFYLICCFLDLKKSAIFFSRQKLNWDLFFWVKMSIRICKSIFQINILVKNVFFYSSSFSYIKQQHQQYLLHCNYLDEKKNDLQSFFMCKLVEKYVNQLFKSKLQWRT